MRDGDVPLTNAEVICLRPAQNEGLNYIAAP